MFVQVGSSCGNTREDGSHRVFVQVGSSCGNTREDGSHLVFIQVGSSCGNTREDGSHLVFLQVGPSCGNCGLMTQILANLNGSNSSTLRLNNFCISNAFNNIHIETFSNTA